MAQTIQFLRSGTVFIDKTTATNALNTISHLPGQPVVSFYGSSDNPDFIFVIGTKEGTGDTAYKIMAEGKALEDLQTAINIINSDISNINESISTINITISGIEGDISTISDDIEWIFEELNNITAEKVLYKDAVIADTTVGVEGSPIKLTDNQVDMLEEFGRIELGVNKHMYKTYTYAYVMTDASNPRYLDTIKFNANVYKYQDADFNIISRINNYTGGDVVMTNTPLWIGKGFYEHKDAYDAQKDIYCVIDCVICITNDTSYPDGLWRQFMLFALDDPNYPGAVWNRSAINSHTDTPTHYFELEGGIYLLYGSYIQDSNVQVEIENLKSRMDTVRESVYNYIDDNLEIFQQNLDGKEDVSNKVNISSTATTTQYPNAKSVWDLTQDLMATIPAGGLKVPLSLNLESQLPDINTQSPGDYYFIQEMDITAPERTGRAWVNYENPEDTSTPLRYYKVVDQYHSLDGISITQTGGGAWEVNMTWLSNVIDEKLAQLSAEDIKYPAKVLDKTPGTSGTPIRLTDTQVDTIIADGKLPIGDGKHFFKEYEYEYTYLIDSEPRYLDQLKFSASIVKYADIPADIVSRINDYDPGQISLVPDLPIWIGSGAYEYRDPDPQYDEVSNITGVVVMVTTTDHSDGEWYMFYLYAPDDPFYPNYIASYNLVPDSYIDVPSHYSYTKTDNGSSLYSLSGVEYYGSDVYTEIEALKSLTSVIPSMEERLAEISIIPKSEYQYVAFVNNTYTGSNPDGSFNRPFRTLQEATDTVPSNLDICLYIIGTNFVYTYPTNPKRFITYVGVGTDIYVQSVNIPYYSEELYIPPVTLENIYVRGTVEINSQQHQDLPESINVRFINCRFNGSINIRNNCGISFEGCTVPGVSMYATRGLIKYKGCSVTSSPKYLYTGEFPQFQYMKIEFVECVGVRCEHQYGSLIVRDSELANINDPIVSTANGEGNTNVLALYNVSFVRNDVSTSGESEEGIDVNTVFRRLVKTGTANLILSNVAYGSNSIITGGFVLYNNSAQRLVISRTNYTALETSGQVNPAIDYYIYEG